MKLKLSLVAIISFSIHLSLAKQNIKYLLILFLFITGIVVEEQFIKSNNIIKYYVAIKILLKILNNDHNFAQIIFVKALNKNNS